MDLIALEGMRFYAYHGFYEEERIIGGEFEVDIYIHTSIKAASVEDDLYKTINYETVYLLCEAEMRKPKKLLETVAQSLVFQMKYHFNSIQNLKVRIRKLNPPLGGMVKNAYVETENSYLSKCGKCGKGIACYRDGTCWCFNLNIPSKTQEHLQDQFGSCLCASCLKYYIGDTF